MKKRSPLVGQTRGNLEILERLDDKKIYGQKTLRSFRMYRCKCLVCGRECIKNSSQLTSYHKKTQKELSCGCDIGEIRIFNDHINKNNVSGIKGISWSTEKRTWRADVRYKGKTYYLARSDDLSYLAMVRKEAEEAIKNKNFEEWISKLKEAM